MTKYPEKGNWKHEERKGKEEKEEGGILLTIQDTMSIMQSKLETVTGHITSSVRKTER